MLHSSQDTGSKKEAAPEIQQVGLPSNEDRLSEVKPTDARWDGEYRELATAHHHDLLSSHEGYHYFLRNPWAAFSVIFPSQNWTWNVTGLNI